MTESRRLELRTFGGLRVLHDGVEEQPIPDRLSMLLAVLLAARGRSVGRSDLVDLIWPVRPPASAQNQVHRSVGELRRVLEPGLGVREHGAILERHNDGYRVRTAGVELDLDRFDALVSDARRSLERADAEGATARLLQACEIAAEPAFSNLPQPVSGRPDLAAIEEERVSAAVELAEIALRTAAPARAVAAVGRIAAQAPLHEVLHAAYIRLLTAAGRASEGLRHFADVRDVLREALGADPGAALRAAHQEALSAGREVVAPPAALQPSSLPPANRAYVEPPGVERLLAQLRAGLGRSGSVTVLSGGGGIGKTTLAVRLARALEDGAGAPSLFLDLRGFDPEQDPLPPDAAIGIALTQLGIDSRGLSSEAQVRALRAAVRERPAVAVLDSAYDAEQIRPLLACLGGSSVIVTSRATMQTLVVREGALLRRLDRWDQESSVALLAERLGLDRAVEAHPALARIAAACAGLPLALAIAAARCAGLEPEQWEAVARELEGEDAPLDAFSVADGSDDVRSVFASSLRDLPERTVQVFRRSALLPGASAELHALAAVSGLGLDAARHELAVLAESSLLRDDGGGWFAMHDLVRTYALELVDPSERAEVQSRAISYLAMTARGAWGLTGRPPVGQTAAARVPLYVVPAFADMAHAYVWTSQNAEWIAALRRAAISSGSHRDAVTTQLDLRPSMEGLVSLADHFDLLSELDPVAELLGDPVLLAEIRFTRGALAAPIGRLDEADRLWRSAIELFESFDDAGGIAKVYRAMTFRAARDDRFDDAERWATLAAQFAERSGHESLIVAAGGLRLNVLGELGRFELIVEIAPAIVEAARRSSPADLPGALERYAFALYSTGELNGALRAARESVELFGVTRIDSVHPLQTVALAAARLGRTAESRDAIARFERFATDGPVEFDAYFENDAEEVRGHFREAAAILAAL